MKRSAAVRRGARRRADSRHRHVRSAVRPPDRAFLADELIIDCFAGGGGAGKGLAEACGRPVDHAINHDSVALAVYKASSPHTTVHATNIWEIDPRKVCGNRRVGIAWFSPDCTFHSRARGGKPLPRKAGSRRRALAWVVLWWARTVKPRVIGLENVVEFLDWGPLDAKGRPIQEKKGLSFRIWLGKLRAAGYNVEWRTLMAADYGTPTRRVRLYFQARRDGLPIVWPTKTHGPGCAEPHRVAAHILDFSRLGRSIFGRVKPLVENTLRRVATGIMREVIGNVQPFMIPVTHQGDARVYSVSEPTPTITAAKRGEIALVAPVYGRMSAAEVPNLIAPVMLRAYKDDSSDGSRVPAKPVTEPLTAVTTRDHHWLTAAFLAPFYGTAVSGQSVMKPLCAVLTGCGRGGGHHALVQAQLGEPKATLFRHARRVYALLRRHCGYYDPRRLVIVTIDGVEMMIVDVLLRMLDWDELAAAMGFGPDHAFHVVRKKDGTINKGKVVQLIGNAVCKQVVEAMFRDGAKGPVGQLSLRGCE